MSLLLLFESSGDASLAGDATAAASAAAALSLLAVVWNLDLSFHDNPATPEMELGWMKETTYGTIRMLLEGGGLAALRMAFFSPKNP